VQKARETSTNIPRYCTVGYCTVPCGRSSCYTCSFSFKLLKKVKLDDKSLIRCFGVKYHRIVLLIVCILTRLAGSSKYSTTRKNIRRYFTPKNLIRYIYCKKQIVPRERTGADPFIELVIFSGFAKRTIQKLQPSSPV